MRRKKVGGSKPAPWCGIGEWAILLSLGRRSLGRAADGCCVTGYAALSAWPLACLMHPTRWRA